jgi:threonylcarbamoyladenosine tRNA methylthiotransferase MtaB
VTDPQTTFTLKTFGCKVNTYDSSILESRFAKLGWDRFATSPKGPSVLEGPSVHVLNSCAVTAEATRETLREARRLKRKNPQSLVVVTGCSAQVDTEILAQESAIDLIVANSDKGDLESHILAHLEQSAPARNPKRIVKRNIFKKEEFEPGGGTESTRTRTFLKIQDGCNSFCTFCVIPFARGKSRSLSIEALIRRILEFEERGFKEVVLTGVHIGDYEFGLSNLVRSVLGHTTIPRIRLSSLEPIELDDELLELYADPRLCPHFHMSIQSAQSEVLRRMKRKYDSAAVAESLLKIKARVPGAYVGMDVIVGFPGEGESEFAETYERLSDLPWTRIHVFPYSERPGTFALRLDGKNESSLTARRADRLRELSSARYEAEARRQIGTIKQVMYLKDRAPEGLSRDYWPVSWAVPQLRTGPQPGDEVVLRIDKFIPAEGSRMDGHLLGSVHQGP